MNKDVPNTVIFLVKMYAKRGKPTTKNRKPEEEI
jgi:hypothetical protein